MDEGEEVAVEVGCEVVVEIWVDISEIFIELFGGV